MTESEGVQEGGEHGRGNITGWGGVGGGRREVFSGPIGREKNLCFILNGMGEQLEGFKQRSNVDNVLKSPPWLLLENGLRER